MSSVRGVGGAAAVTPVANIPSSNDAMAGKAQSHGRGFHVKALLDASLFMQLLEILLLMGVQHHHKSPEQGAAAYGNVQSLGNVTPTASSTTA